MNKIDLSGRKFGRWTVLRADKKNSPRRKWQCRCVCGKLRSVDSHSLKSGTSKSCGCLRTEELKSRTVHGESGSKLYQVWFSMLKRCYNPNSKSYKNYGGRGVKVCWRWHQFSNWLQDVGRPPFLGASLERKNNSKGYAPSNVCWASKEEQANNTRANVHVHYLGRRMTLKKASDLSGIKYTTLHARYFRIGLRGAKLFETLHPGRSSL
jgi:hypothetical protein